MPSSVRAEQSLLATPDPDAPEETTPEEPQVEQEQAEDNGNERVTRLGVEYEVTPEHGHRQVR